MATLQSIIAAVLDDLIEAQNTANVRSAQLSRSYREGRDLHFFPVPNALLDEADITLQFGIDAIDSADPSQALRRTDASTPTQPRIVAVDIALEVSALVLRTLRARLDGRGTGVEAEGAKAAELRRQLGTPAVRRTLTRNLALSLTPLLALDAVDPDRSSRETDARHAVRDALELTFGADTDLAAEIGPARIWAEQIGMGDAGTHAAAALARRAANGTGDDTRALPSMVVSLAPRLGDVPDNLIQTVRLHARMRNYKWVIVAEDDPDHDQLVPEA